MKKRLITLLLMFPFYAWMEENFNLLGQQAEALWEARDYTAASQVYEKLLRRSVPSWQQARLLYNLATIRLAQHQTIDALDLLQRLTPNELSLPSFGRNLFINQAIAYWQYVQTLAATASWSSLAEQALFLEQSLQALKQAEILDCQGQRMEEESSTFTCHPFSLIGQWSKVASLQLHAVHAQQRQAWMASASLEQLASFLSHFLQELAKRLSDLQNQHETLEHSLAAYFQHQLTSFFPIWNALQQKQFSPDQKASFDQAVAFYLQAQQALNQFDFAAALKEIRQAIEALDPLKFKKNQALQQAYLNYEIFLLQDSISTSGLQRLVDQFNRLKVSGNPSEQLKSIQAQLETSLMDIQTGHTTEARIFLIAGLSPLESLVQQKSNSPILILQQALRQAQRALQLFLLAQVMAEEPPQNRQIPSILNQQQQAILAQAAPFIPAVLNEQKTRFQQATETASGCQQFPWEQVIPLFDQGWQAAERATQQLGDQNLKPQAVVANQKQTIQAWQQALNLMLHPPQQNRPSPSATTSSSPMPQNLTETFRLIQEMYLEDQSQPAKSIEELHSW
jgi:hypothetical protein